MSPTNRAAKKPAAKKRFSPILFNYLQKKSEVQRDKLNENKPDVTRSKTARVANTQSSYLPEITDSINDHHFDTPSSTPTNIEVIGTIFHQVNDTHRYPFTNHECPFAQCPYSSVQVKTATPQKKAKPSIHVKGRKNASNEMPNTFNEIRIAEEKRWASYGKEFEYYIPPDIT